MTATQLLDEQPESVRGAESGRPLKPSTLRRLTLKLVVNHGLLPRSFYLKGVKCTSQESQGAGFFADIYLGDWKGRPVALKRLRVTQSSQQDRSLRMVRAELRFVARSRRLCYRRKVCRESIMWRKLSHEYVLPFYGVSEDVFRTSVCMVTPWMKQGNSRHFLNQQASSGFGFIQTIDLLVCPFRQYSSTRTLILSCCLGCSCGKSLKA